MITRTTKTNDGNVNDTMVDNTVVYASSLRACQRTPCSFSQRNSLIFAKTLGKRSVLRRYSGRLIKTAFVKIDMSR